MRWKPELVHTWCAGSQGTVGGHPGDNTAPIPAIREEPYSSAVTMRVRALADASAGRKRSPLQVVDVSRDPWIRLARGVPILKYPASIGDHQAGFSGTRPYPSSSVSLRGQSMI